jgi:hypothetical protein
VFLYTSYRSTGTNFESCGARVVIRHWRSKPDKAGNKGEKNWICNGETVRRYVGLKFHELYMNNLSHKSYYLIFLSFVQQISFSLLSLLFMLSGAIIAST